MTAEEAKTSRANAKGAEEEDAKEHHIVSYAAKTPVKSPEITNKTKWQESLKKWMTPPRLAKPQISMCFIMHSVKNRQAQSYGQLYHPGTNNPIYQITMMQGF